MVVFSHQADERNDKEPSYDDNTTLDPQFEDQIGFLVAGDYRHETNHFNQRLTSVFQCAMTL